MNKVVFIYLLSLSMCYCTPSEPLGKPQPVTNDTVVAKPGTEAAGTTNTTKVAPVTPLTNQTTPTNKTTEKDVATTAVAPQDNATTKATPTLIPSVPTEAAKTEKPVPSNKPTTTAATPTPAPVIDTTTHKNDKPTEKPSSKTTTTPATHPEDKTEPPLQARGFDGGSFVGGIVLTLGMLAIGFIGYRYYRSQTEQNYHTL